MLPSATYPLQILQNKMLRILQGKPLRSPTIDFYNEYYTFRLRDLFEINSLKLTYKIIHHPDLLPEIFQDYLTLNHDIHSYETRNRNDIFVHHVNSSFGKKLLNLGATNCGTHFPSTLKILQAQPYLTN